MKQIEDKKIIVDEKGRQLTGNSYDRFATFVSKNIRKIVEMGIPIITLVSTILGYIGTVLYAKECSTFYGAHERYFDDDNMFWQKLLTSALIVSMAAAIIFFFINHKERKKWKTALVYIIGVVYGMIINLYCLVPISVKYEFNIYVDLFMLIIIFVWPFLLSYYFVVKDMKKLSKVDETIFSVVLSGFILIVCLGVGNQLSANVEDISKYEMINNELVVVSDYEGKFVVMECYVDDDNVLYINKGNYKLIEETDVMIFYNKFKDVECEAWEE